MNPVVQRVSLAFREAFVQMKAGEFDFPTSLDASRRVLKAMENPEIGLAALAKIVISEPLLSAKVIQLANSAAMNPGDQAVCDVRLAVTRIGMDPIKALVMVLIVNQLRQSPRHGSLRHLANRLWERSISVAALAYVIAGKMTALNPDEAMFAGIVHDLGRFYLLARAADYQELMENQEVLAETVNDLNVHATRRVLEELKLPASIVETVIASEAYNGNESPAVMSEVLFLARILSPRQDPFDALDRRAMSAVNVNAGTAPEFDKSIIQEAIAASRDEIHSIIAALKS